jgi:rare lipoprotein A (peptidoglycan hydrolase)
MKCKIALLAALLFLPACADYKQAPKLNADKFAGHKSKTSTASYLDFDAEYTEPKEDETELPQIKLYDEEGLASWYGPGFHGRKTANGERFDQYAMTAAHKELKMGTKVEVTNIETGETVLVRINDRGPYAGERIIDLSKAAAKKIGLLHDGVGKVRVKQVE